MQLKHRVPLFFSLLFSLMLATVLVTVYYLFANFRKMEFKDRLAQKAQTTIKLLLEVNEVDNNLLKIIDRNTINKLYNEKTLVFNDSMHLIYSSIDDAVVNWTAEDLNILKRHKEVFKQRNGYDILGLYYKFQGEDYYAFISARDIYGISKLNYLKFLLFGAFLISTAMVWLISFFLSKKALQPLDRLRRQMQEITSKNLMVRVHEPQSQDEIRALSKSFNQMLDRIDRAYKGQKNFTSNASHELRTPLARIAMQLENLVKCGTLDVPVKTSLESALHDIHQMSDMITSLLLLSRIEDAPGSTLFQPVRLDEVIFKTASRISSTYPDFKLQFEIEHESSDEVTMEILGDETLLEIAISNLLHNAYSYSSNQTVKCVLKQDKATLQLIMVNHGAVPVLSDTSVLFNTFTRGGNVKHTPGSGIGLSIVQRILYYHQATIVYNIPDSNTNEIVVSFYHEAA